MTVSSIEWTEHAWNPVTGCSKVSPGCAHCYAEGVALRFWGKQYQKVEFCGEQMPRDREFTDVWTHEDRLSQPLKRRKPTTYFVNSMSDLFHEDVPDSFIDQVFAVMALTPQHTYQVLTKRPGRMRAYLSAPMMASVRIAAEAKRIHTTVRPFALPSTEVFDGRRVALGEQWIIPTDRAWPLKNVWLGVSVENQHFADERIPLLLQTPAAVRFISAEPLLGAIDIRPYMPNTLWNDLPSWKQPELNWVIVGGESGPGARPFHLDWARSIVRHCSDARVPAFVKQLGAQPVYHRWEDKATMPVERIEDRKGGDMAEWPEDLRVRQMPVVRA